VNKKITEKTPHNMYLYNRLGLGHTKKCLGSQANFVKKKEKEMDEGGMVFFLSRNCLPFFKKFHQIHYCSYCDSIKDDLLYIFSKQKFVFNIILRSS
jgi:hypothetical protein